jgi:hypothetical protein
MAMSRKRSMIGLGIVAVCPGVLLWFLSSYTITESPYYGLDSAAASSLQQLAQAEAALQTAHARSTGDSSRCEFACIRELVAATPVPPEPQRLPPTDSTTVQVYYRFIVYLPDGMDTAVTESALRSHDPAATELRRQYWVAYAWPDSHKDFFRRMFAIDQHGRVYSRMIDPQAAMPPAWNAFTGQWGGQPMQGWVPFRN